MADDDPAHLVSFTLRWPQHLRERAGAAAAAASMSLADWVRQAVMDKARRDEAQVPGARLALLRGGQAAATATDGPGLRISLVDVIPATPAGTRLVNALRSWHGVTTLDGLTLLTEADLLGMRYIGAGCVQIAKDTLAVHGLKLRDTTDA